MRPGHSRRHARPMPHFLIHNTHTADDCGVVFSSFKGFTSPLRGTRTPASCHLGGHEIWWRLDAADEEQAVALLPPYVAGRATVTHVQDVLIP
jgi:hypothetical protein